MEYILDNLYGYDKMQKIKEWRIKVVKNEDNTATIIFSYGYINGKRTECKLTIFNGKNRGKRNETTAYEQGILEAQSKWNKKREDGYKKSIEELKKTEIHTFLPMLAHDYKKHSKKITFPCYIQPKLDGYRMVYNHLTKQATTRAGKLYNVFQYSELAKQLNSLNINYCLDGELYVHDPTFNFETYGVLRKVKISEKDLTLLNTISYHVYDIIDTTKTFEERQKILQAIETNNSLIKIVKTIKCDSHNEISREYNKFIKDNYEGAIVRNAKSKYTCKHRSFDLQKYKEFDDSEFKIVDYTFENDTSGQNEHLIVWICQTECGRRFNVQSTGTKIERQALYKIAHDFIGKLLWVKYFGITADGIPRFPKTQRPGQQAIREEIV